MVIKEYELNMWAFIAPFLAFMLIGMLYPNFARVAQDSIEPTATIDSDQHEIAELNSAKTNNYIALIGIQVIVAFGLLLFFRKTYLEQFPLKLHYLAIPIGVIGVALWVGICGLGIELAILEPFGLSKLVEVRASFNPFQQISDDTLRILFLALRFCLLALLVPIIEELFVRGWLIRYLEDPKWWTVSLSSLSLRSVAFASVYGVFTHPGEAVAAFVWFSLISWLMVRTGNFWDCVVAHAVTNLLLGLYVVTYSAWHLW